MFITAFTSVMVKEQSWDDGGSNLGKTGMLKLALTLLLISLKKEKTRNKMSTVNTM